MITKQMDLFTGTKLTLASHAQYHNSVYVAILKTTAAALHIEDLATQYAAAVTAELSVVNRQTGSAITIDIAVDDHRRDQAHSLLNAVVTAYNDLAAAGSEQQKAGHTLYMALRPYSGINGHEYSRETTEVDGLLALFEDDEMAKHATLLGLEWALGELGSANEAVKKALSSRDSEAATRAPIKEIDSRQARHDVDAIYTKIAQTVSAFAIAIPDAKIDAFIDQANAIAQRYRTVAANQAKHKATPEPTTTEETTTASAEAPEEEEEKMME
ncbi:MAG: DUF6261 family protein [Bacteroides sp.]|nr:DUF6261 family protein [Bacteroides sp.]